jgi:hypothetical protein
MHYVGRDGVPRCSCRHHCREMWSVRTMTILGLTRLTFKEALGLTRESRSVCILKELVPRHVDILEVIVTWFVLTSK